jgi:hypothetical protein
MFLWLSVVVMVVERTAHLHSGLILVLPLLLSNCSSFELASFDSHLLLNQLSHAQITSADVVARAVPLLDPAALVVLE